MAAAGQQAQTLFQQPWIIVLFALLFVAMAVSMFGFYTVQMPSFIQTRLTEMSNRQRSGNFAGVAAMARCRSLIVTTCVGPGAGRALTAIGQSGQIARGGLALFCMALGMGVPLLVVGASAGELLPRAGAWMDTVKQVFGAMMLAVGGMDDLAHRAGARDDDAVGAAAGGARRDPDRATTRGAARRAVLRFAGAIAALYAVVLLVGGVRGATDPLRPLQVTSSVEHLPFARIKSLADLEREVAAAKAAGRPVMLDFYADWCVSCKEMEKYTFPTPAVRGALAQAVLLQADVTANDDDGPGAAEAFRHLRPRRPSRSTARTAWNARTSVS